MKKLKVKIIKEEKKKEERKRIKVVAKKVKKRNKIKVTAYNNSILLNLIDGTDFDSPIEYINNAVKYISNVWAMCITYDENTMDLQSVYELLLDQKQYDINTILDVVINTSQGKLDALGILKQSNIILQRAGYVLRLLNKKGINTSEIKYNSHELYHAMFWHAMGDKKSLIFTQKSPIDINDILVRNGGNIIPISLKKCDFNDNNIFHTIDDIIIDSDLDTVGTYIMIPLNGNKYINVPYLSFSRLLELSDVNISIDIAEFELDEIIIQFNQDALDMLSLLYIMEDYNTIERFIYMRDHCNQLYLDYGIYIKNAEVTYKIKNKTITSSYSEFMDKYFRFMEE